MTEFFQEIIQGPNLIATGLLILVAIYWLCVILGFLGLEALDIDLDVDADVDVDVGGSFEFGDLLRFFHLGEVPVMIFVSFFAMFFWLTTIMTNHYFNHEFSMLVMLLFIMPCILVSLLATKLVIMPMVPLFVTENDPHKSRKMLVGQKAIVTTSEVNEKFGQVSIKQDGPPIVLNARTNDGNTLTKGEFVELVEHIKDGDLFIVKLSKWEKT